MSFWQPSTFDGRFRKHFSCLIVGQRNSGKTSALLSWLIKKQGLLDEFDRIIIFTSLSNKNVYSKFINPIFIHSISDKEIELLYSKFENVVGRLINQGHIVPSTLWIFDDRLNAKTRFQKSVESLFVQGRHLASSVFYITQSITGLSATVRRNLDFFCYLKSPCLLYRDKRSIILDFLGMLPHQHSTFILDNLKPYQCLVLDQKAGIRKNGWHDRIMLYSVNKNILEFINNN